MKFLPIRQAPRRGTRAALTAALALLGGLSCAPAVREEQAKAAPARSVENETREKLGPTVGIKESPLQEQAFRVQDLTINEDRGQTTLRIKFSEQVSQYRHFPLMQPA